MKARYRRNDRGQKRIKDPLSGMLVCPLCGKNLRRHTEYKGTVTWICGTRMDKGIGKCAGIRVEDEEVQKQGITEPTVVEEVERNGRKYYRYTSKAEWDGGGRAEAEGTEAAHGSVLPGVNRPRRTAIKL
ncbi:zinc ribbon domain-containing protein [Blautia producta]|uniref:zinc ribbon domain-containing protein n=1 Tax=Blautia producta TaxID=33035 RepID=UPI0031B5D4BF